MELWSTPINKRGGVRRRVKGRRDKQNREDVARRKEGSLMSTVKEKSGGNKSISWTES